MPNHAKHAIEIEDIDVRVAAFGRTVEDGRTLMMNRSLSRRLQKLQVKLLPYPLPTRAMLLHFVEPVTMRVSSTILMENGRMVSTYFDENGAIDRIEETPPLPISGRSRDS